MESAIPDSTSSSLRSKKPNIQASNKVPTFTSNNNMTENANLKVSKESNNVNNEAVKSLASNLESSLTLDSSNTSSLSLASSNSSNNATFSNNNNNDASNVSDNNESANNDSSKSLQNVSKFGTPVPNRVFVGGIPIDATENDVRYLFAQYGTISSVKIITDRAGVSRGYGFVTYETEEDAQKVIKEAENLIIKNRKLNVSTAVMKHQQNSYDSRVVHNGFMYQQLPYTGANYNQYYTDNFHSLCPAEGLPIYQIAGVNGHFVSNCPSLIASPSAQYVTQSAAAAFTSPYQSPAGFIYSGVSPGAASIPIPSQHPIYHAQSQHLLSGTSLHGAPGFQYTAAPQANANSNSPTIHTLRYPLPPTHHSSNTQSTQVNLNGSNNQQYIQFSSSASPAINHPSMHLATTLPIHPHSHLASIHQLSPVSEMSNMATSATGVANLPSGASNQLNAAILHHHQSHHGHPHQPSPLYTTYPSNMATTHQLTTSSSQMACVQNVHLKTDSSGIELLDNVPTAVINGPGINPTGANSSGIASLPPSVHLANNAGYMPQMMEVVWPSSHMSNVAAYCGATTNISNAVNCPPGNPNNSNNNNYKSNQSVSGNRNSSVVVSISSSLNSANNNPAVTYFKSTNNSNQTNNYGNNLVSLASSTSNNSSALNSTNVTNTLNQSNTLSSKDKILNLRHNNSSYGTSHKKVYNGPYNYNNSNNNSVNKSKMLNGGTPNNSNNNLRYSNSVDTADQTPSENGSSTYAIPSTQKQNFAKHGYQQQQQSANIASSSSSMSYTNIRTNLNNNNNGLNNTQAYITKTVNGVQIYVLAGNGEGTCITSKTSVADNLATSTPPHTPGGDVTTNTTTNNNTVFSYKA